MLGWINGSELFPYREPLLREKNSRLPSHSSASLLPFNQKKGKMVVTHLDLITNPLGVGAPMLRTHSLDLQRVEVSIAPL